MKILLIYPIDREFLPPSVFPLGIGYIIAVLKKAGHKVFVCDMNGNREGGEEQLKRLIVSNNFDWIGMSSIITQYKKVKVLGKKIKELKPNVPLVMGGAGPTSHPSLYIKNTYADIVVVGEGERIVLDLCEFLERGKDLKTCPDLCLKRDNDSYFTPKQNQIENLNKKLSI